MELWNAYMIWCDIYKKDVVKPSSYTQMVRLGALIRKHRLGQMDEDAVTSTDIQQFFNELHAEGYSPSTERVLKTRLGEFYRRKEYETGKRNPCSITHVSKKNKNTKVKCYNTRDQYKLKKELMTLKQLEYGAALLMLECGLRVGEALALSWDDILWERKAISINKTRLVWGVQDSAKTDTSNRVIPISDDALNALLEISDSGTDGFIFADENGEPFTYYRFQRTFKNICEQVGIPYLGSHALRHTFASNCYARGCDIRTLSKMLGHSSVTITYDVYIHWFDDSVEEMRSVYGKPAQNASFGLRQN